MGIPLGSDPLKSFTVIEENPSCLIMGSFRFKNVIDQTIDLFEGNGIRVLAPRKGNVVRGDDEGDRLLWEFVRRSGEKR